MPRWKKYLLALFLGLVAGLLYGWLINPLEYINTTPETLSADYRADYVLMAAEVYAASLETEPVVRALSILSALDPASVAAEALAYAQAFDYPQSDIALLQDLTIAMQSMQTGGTP